MSSAKSTGANARLPAKHEPDDIPPMPSESNSGDSDLRHRRRGPVAASEKLFAGRIGGVGDFIADPSTSEGRELLKNQPDAAPLLTFRATIDPAGFRSYEIWRGAVIEGWGTALSVFILGMVASASTGLTTPPLANILYSALANWLGLTLFIYSAGPASGGHLNPVITMATLFTGLCSLPRAILYIVAQCTGAIVGAYWLKLGLGDSYFPNNWIPGCTVGEYAPNPGPISLGEFFVLEYMMSLAMIFLAFGAGLDPRNAKTLGPAYSPVLVGMSLAFATLTSALVKPGYTGVSFNPARCLGLMTAWGNLQHHYIHWLAPLAATIANGLFYYFAPPFKRNRKSLSQLL